MLNIISGSQAGGSSGRESRGCGVAVYRGRGESESVSEVSTGNPLFPLNTSLKGPKHEIFEGGFFTEIRPVRIGDLGTGKKKRNFVSWSPNFKVFAANILLSVCSACA